MVYQKRPAQSAVLYKQNTYKIVDEMLKNCTVTQQVMHMSQNSYNQDQVKVFDQVEHKLAESWYYQSVS